MTDSLVERLGNMHVDDATLSEAQDLITALSAANKRLNRRIINCMARRAENEKLLFAQQWIAEQARKIEELETALEAILECVEDQDDCAVVAICNTALKATPTQRR
jgi:hypothetical protein